MIHEELSYEASLIAADELIELMRDHEHEVASVMEPLLFPDGPPASLTVAEIMRAQARLLARSAQSMAEADIAYNTAVQKHRPPTPGQTSLISQDVAQKLALSAELENLVFSMAEDIEAKVTPKLFPNGLPPGMTLLGFLKSLRECMESERSGMPEPTAEPMEDAQESLHKTMNTIATIYSGFCDQANLEDLAEEIRSYTSLDE